MRAAKMIATTAVWIAAIAGVGMFAEPARAYSAATASDPLYGYQLRVPGSVVAAAAPTVPGLSQDSTGAALAGSLELAEAGDLSVPVAAESALGAAEIGGPLVSGAFVFEAGTAAAKAVGVDYEQGLCSGAPSGPDRLLAQLTLTDCTQYDIAAGVAAQLNEDTTPNASALAVGSTSCDSQDHCAQIYAVTSNGHGYCVQSTGSAPFETPDSWNSSDTRVVVADWGAYRTGGTGYYDDAEQYRFTGECDARPDTRIAELGIVNGTQKVHGWAADGLAWLEGKSVPLPEPTYSDVDRQLVCTVRLDDGARLSSTGETFTEGGGRVPSPSCPAIPAGRTAMHYSVVMAGGPSDVTLASFDTTAAYQLWRTDFPECQDGSCALDLVRDQASCFGRYVVCDGWIDAIDRDAHYQCLYGTHLVDLSECFVYASMFAPGNPQYASPSTGAPSSIPTVPSDEDRLTKDLIDRHWDVWGPTLTGITLGIPASDEARYARLVAIQCIQLGLQSGCDNIPIFAPGDDVREAAQHDADAIAGRDGPPQSAILHRALVSPANPGWYRSTEPCLTGSYDGKSQHCDEYPFRKTREAGPGASLRAIANGDNILEGSYLGHFFSVCGLEDGDPFVTIPIVTPPSQPRTTITSEWCVPDA